MTCSDYLTDTYPYNCYCKKAIIIHDIFLLCLYLYVCPECFLQRGCAILSCMFNQFTLCQLLYHSPIN